MRMSGFGWLNTIRHKLKGKEAVMKWRNALLFSELMNAFFYWKGQPPFVQRGSRQLLSFSFAASETRSRPRLPFDKLLVFTFTTILIIPIVRTNGNGSQSHPLLENSRGNHAKCIRGVQETLEKVPTHAGRRPEIPKIHSIFFDLFSPCF